jgi:hypothetical protein
MGLRPSGRSRCEKQVEPSLVRSHAELDGGPVGVNAFVVCGSRVPLSTGAQVGVRGHLVAVEAHVGRGLPSLTLTDC